MLKETNNTTEYATENQISNEEGQLTTVAMVLDNATSSLRKNFSAQLLLTIAFHTLSMVTLFLFVWIGFSFVMPFLSANSSNAALTGIYTLLFIFTFCSFLISFFMDMLATSNMICEDSHVLPKKAFSNAFISSWKQSFSVLLFSLCKFIVYLPIVFLLCLIAYSNIDLLNPTGNFLVLFCILALSFLVLFFVNTCTLVALPIVIHQHKKGFTSLYCSFRLMANPFSFFRELTSNLFWFLLIGVFSVFLYWFLGLFVHLPLFILNIPYGSYLLPFYKCFLVYVLLFFLTPFRALLSNEIWKQLANNKTSLNSRNLQNHNALLASRTFAEILDIFIQLSIFLPIFYFLIVFLAQMTLSFQAFLSMPLSAWFLLWFLFSCASTIYHTAFEFLWKGKTPGKKLMGLYVCNQNETEPKFYQLFLRNAGKCFFERYFIGSFFIFFLTNNSRIGDILAKTKVTYAKAGFPRNPSEKLTPS